MSATTNRDQIEACLRVVSNRCRNLRKTIDRAKTWEAAAESGQSLNDEQTESVRTLPRKEALLAELTEILKKQNAIADQPADSAPSTPAAASSPRPAARASKAAAKPAPDPDPKPASDADPADPAPASEDPQLDPADAPADQTDPADAPEQQAAQSDAEPKSSSSTPPADSSASPPRAADRAPADPTGMSDAVNEMLAMLDVKHASHLRQTKTDSVRAALNLFHVVDYVRQEGSREALLAYFNSLVVPRTGRETRRLSSLDIDLLIYFNVMLTSPNGNVPHPEAVDVSTAHCVKFINNSSEEAFQDTSYRTLVDIVNTIATCPILTDRCEPADVEETNKHVYNTNPQGEPGHLVEAASTKAAMP